MSLQRWVESNLDGGFPQRSLAWGVKGGAEFLDALALVWPVVPVTVLVKVFFPTARIPLVTGITLEAGGLVRVVVTAWLATALYAFITQVYCTYTE